MDNKTVNKIYEKLSKSLPEAKSELNFKNNFELLVSVILSAQTTDKNVNAVTKVLFDRFPTPAALLKCGETKLKTIIMSIGLGPTKARNIIKTCKILLDQHNGEVPGNREALEKLPGVGRKTANVVLNEGFGHHTIAVDTHVFRVANRTGIAPSNTVLETEEKLLQITPAMWMGKAHHYLILHGRYVCKARLPLCGQCAIREECKYKDKHIADAKT